MSTIRHATIHLRIEAEQEFAGSLVELLSDWGFADQTQEALWAVAIDSIQQVRTVVEVARGNYHEVDVPIAAVLSVPLLAATDRFIVIHNHPSGDISPTILDIDLTSKILAAANMAGLYFEDHLIIGPDGNSYSFAEHGILAPSVTMKRAAQHHRKA